MRILTFKFAVFYVAMFTVFLFIPLASWAVFTCPHPDYGTTGVCFSDNRGEELYCWAQHIIAGDIGTIIGLVIAFSGFLTWIWQKSIIGIVILLIGLSITGFPGLYQSFLGTLGKVTMSYSLAPNRYMPHSYSPMCGWGSPNYPDNCGTDGPTQC